MSQYITDTRPSQARPSQTDAAMIQGPALAAVYQRLAGLCYGGPEIDAIVSHLQHEGTFAGAPHIGPTSEAILEETLVESFEPIPFDDARWGSTEDLEDDDIIFGTPPIPDDICDWFRSPEEWAAKDAALEIASEAPDGREVAQKLLDSGRLLPIAGGAPDLADEWTGTAEFPAVVLPPICGGSPEADDDWPIPSDADLAAHLEYQRWLDSIAGIPDDQPEPVAPTRFNSATDPATLGRIRLALWGF